MPARCSRCRQIRAFTVWARARGRAIWCSGRIRFVYVLNEWAGNIAVFHFENNTLVHKQTVVSTDILPPGERNKGSAAIKISPDGRHLYASNRGNANRSPSSKLPPTAC